MKLAPTVLLADQEMRNRFGKELLRRGEYEAACQEFDGVVRGCGLADIYDRSEALANLGRAASQKGDFARAALYHQRVCLLCLGYNLGMISPSLSMILAHRVCREQARAHLAAGRIEDARLTIRQCLDLLPGNLDLPVALVPALQAKGLKVDGDKLFDSVFGMYEKLIADYPRCAWAQHNLAWLSVRCGRKLDEALKATLKAVELEPSNVLYLDTLAEVYFQKGNKEEASKRMKQCLEREPGSVYFEKQLKRFEAGDPKAPLPTGISWIKKSEEAFVLPLDLSSTGGGFRGHLKGGTGSLNIAPNSFFP